MVICPFCIVDDRCSTMQFFMNLFNNSIWLARYNHGLHPFLFGKDSIGYSARHKDGNHRIKSIFPTKSQTCNQHDGPIDQKGNAPDILSSPLSNGQTDNVRPPTGNVIPKSKTNPCSHDHTSKEGIHNGIVCQGNYRDKLNKEGTHRDCDKGKNGKFMTNLIPSYNHQGNINGIKSQRNRNRKTDKTMAQNR